MNLPTALQPAARKFLLAALAFVAAATSYLAWKLAPDLAPAPTPPTEVQGVMSGAAPEPPPRATGWLPDPAAVGRVRSRLSAPDFAGTEAFQAPYSGPQDVFLWEACRQATGGLLPPRDQGQVGACVGFGTSSAIEHLMCVQQPTVANPMNHGVPGTAPTQSGQNLATAYADLATVVAAWPSLSDPIRRAVLAIVQTAAPAPTGGPLQGLDDSAPAGYELKLGPNAFPL